MNGGRHCSLAQQRAQSAFRGRQTLNQLDVNWYSMKGYRDEWRKALQSGIAKSMVSIPREADIESAGCELVFYESF